MLGIPIWYRKGDNFYDVVAIFCGITQLLKQDLYSCGSLVVKAAKEGAPIVTIPEDVEVPAG